MNDYETTIGRIAAGESVDEIEVGRVAYQAGKTADNVSADTSAVKERMGRRHDFDFMVQTLPPGNALYSKWRNLKRSLQNPDADEQRYHNLSGVSHVAIRAEIESVEATICDPVRGYFESL